MPGLDHTGPRGEGPMTGGGFGNCNPNASNQAANRNALLGVGRGGRPRGGGRGRCFGGGRGGRGRGGFGPGVQGGYPAADATPDELREEIRSLSDEVAALRAELASARGEDAADAEEQA